jgi:phenylacetic acid degradation protein
LPKELHDSLIPCEPLREIPQDRKIQSADYQTWGERKSNEG